MTSKKVSKNLLPLLAVTVLMLSVGSINYLKVSDSKSMANQSVLSDSDERDENGKDDYEKKAEADKKRVEERNEVDSRTGDDINDESEKEQEMTETRTESRAGSEDNDRETFDSEDSEESVLESEFEQEVETEDSDGSVSRFKLKVKTKTVNGKTLVETKAGAIEVSNDPNDTVNNLVENGVIDTPVEFEARTENNKLEYEFKGLESKKLFGLFKVDLEKIVTVDADSGEVVSTNQSIWNRFLNLLSV